MTVWRGAVERGLNAIWYRNSILSWCLLPLSLIVRFEVKRRRGQSPLKGATPDGVMVIVIGGVTVGGYRQNTGADGIGPLVTTRRLSSGCDQSGLPKSAPQRGLPRCIE